MSEAQALIPATEMGIVPSKYATDQAFDSVASAGYLPRLQLYGSGSDAVKQGLIGMAHYGLARGKDQVEDLTKEVAVVVIAWRPKALDLRTPGQVISSYNPQSDLFKKITAVAGEKDSKCMFGPEFLVWVPTAKTFATFFFGSKTARREAPNMKGLIGNAALCKANYIKTSQYSWHGPLITPCSQQLELPDPESIREEAFKFNNPPETEVEAAPEETSDRPR
jgi:hypothetical protein